MDYSKIATPYTVKGVTFWLIPHHNIGTGRAIEQMEKLKPKEEWDSLENVFVLCDPITVAIDCAEDADPLVGVAAGYFASRNGSVLANWQLFNQVLTSEAFNAWWEAYEATRDHTFDAPEALQKIPGEGADPNA